MVFTYYQENWVKFILVFKLVPFLHSAITQYVSYFQAFDILLYNKIYVIAKRLNISLACLQHASML